MTIEGEHSGGDTAEAGVIHPLTKDLQPPTQGAKMGAVLNKS